MCGSGTLQAWGLGFGDRELRSVEAQAGFRAEALALGFGASGSESEP